MSNKREWLAKRVITLKNISFCEYDPGTETVKIDVPARPLTDEEFKLLDELFPNTFKIIDKAFAVEALFNCMED